MSVMISDYGTYCETNREEKEGCRGGGRASALANSWERLPAKVILKMNGKVESQQVRLGGKGIPAEGPASKCKGPEGENTRGTSRVVRSTGSRGK